MSTSERYRRDPAFRELQKKRSRNVYWRKRAFVRRPPVSVFQTAYYADVTITNPADARYGGVVRVPAYRIGQFAALLGKSTQSVRLMIDAGRLPPPLFELDEGKRFGRAFTYDQMRVTWEYLPLLNFPDSRDNPPPKPKPAHFERGAHDPDFKRAHRAWEADMRTHRYDHNIFSRALKEAWSLMPDGVLVSHPTPAGEDNQPDESQKTDGAIPGAQDAGDPGVR